MSYFHTVRYTRGGGRGEGGGGKGEREKSAFFLPSNPPLHLSTPATHTTLHVPSMH